MARGKEQRTRHRKLRHTTREGLCDRSNLMLATEVEWVCLGNDRSVEKEQGPREEGNHWVPTRSTARPVYRLTLDETCVDELVD